MLHNRFSDIIQFTEWPSLPNFEKKGYILFHPLACSNLLWKSNQAGKNVKVGIFQPTVSLQQMVVGNILTGTLRGFHIVRNLQNCMLQNWISLMKHSFIVFNAFAALITYKGLHFSSKLMCFLQICNLISTLSVTVIFLFWLH